jgi:hypothetical protein
MHPLPRLGTMKLGAFIGILVLGLLPLAVTGTQIMGVEWDPGLAVILVRFDAFPNWGGWSMFVDGTEVAMEGGEGALVARPNAPVADHPTGLYIGTMPWLSPLPKNALPCTGTLQFNIPGDGLTNVLEYDVTAGYCTGAASPSAAESVGGTLSTDTTWDGNVLVSQSVFVPDGITLTILPGTRVQFRPYRGYQGPGDRLSLHVEGTLRAVGTATHPIWFTSAADDPTNGDWSMVSLAHVSRDSEIRFAIFEFGQQGINLWNSSPVIRDIIVRWNNWEGIYLESYCHATIERARIYQNGYNGIAMEQFNEVTLRECEIRESGTHAIHVDASAAHVESCLLADNHAAGLSVDNHGSLEIASCWIENNGTGIQCGEGHNQVTRDENTVLVNNGRDTACSSPVMRDQTRTAAAPQTISFSLPDLRPYELGYTPGDRTLDRYTYVYPDRDDTREVVNKIGDGLGLTWSVTWDGEAIWTATLWGAVYRLDARTGAVLDQWQYPGPQAWGMTYDGNHLWINDFAEKRVYEMTTTGEVVSSFSIPDSTGGAKGIAWDGEALCIMGWTSSSIYRVTRQGMLVNTIPLPFGGGGITWDGEAFWVPAGNRIARVSPSGNPIGSIYACSEGTWDLAWDGSCLWATQRTNENWFDEKLYQIRILDLLH